MRCKDLAYKFEFASSSENPDEHFVVQQGYFYQKSMEPLEIVDIDTGRVLSDYVKSVRLEEKQGKLRSTNLITELIAAEENEGEFWDSGALFGVFSASGGVSKKSHRAGISQAGMTVGERGSRGNQGFSSRYPKDVFIGLVKEELERIKEEAIEEQKKDGTFVDGDDDIYKAPRRRLGMTKKQQKDFNLSESKRLYTIRKREKYTDFIAESKKLKGAFIEVFDNGSQAWEHMKVVECKIQWIENGTKPKVEHDVCRINGQMEVVGKPVVMNLKEERFYVSKETTYDEDAQNKWMEHEKLRKQRLKEEKQRLKAAEREARKRREEIGRASCRERVCAYV